MQQHIEEEDSEMADEVKSAATAAATEAMQAPWGPIDVPAPSPDEKLWGMLANVLGLIFVVGPLIAFFMKGAQSKFVKFYAIQMLLIQLVALVFIIALTVVVQVLATVPILLTLMWPLFSLLNLAWLVALVILALKANSGVAFRVPVVGQFAYTKGYAA
jgi:uncharacterized membrane protein